jgi:hypothetical protein
VSELYYDRLSAGLSVLISSTHLGLTTRFFNTVRQLRVSEILSFRTLSIVLVLKKQTKRNTTFRKLDLFPSSGAGKKTYSVGPLERDLRTETDPVSETSCFSLVCFLIPERWIESENSIFLKVIHHRQNPKVTTYIIPL